MISFQKPAILSTEFRATAARSLQRAVLRHLGQQEFVVLGGGERPGMLDNAGRMSGAIASDGRRTQARGQAPQNSELAEFRVVA